MKNFKQAKVSLDEELSKPKRACQRGIDWPQSSRKVRQYYPSPLSNPQEWLHTINKTVLLQAEIKNKTELKGER